MSVLGWKQGPPGLHRDRRTLASEADWLSQGPGSEELTLGGSCRRGIPKAQLSCGPAGRPWAPDRGPEQTNQP